MTLDAALEKAARAVCKDGGLDPDKMLEWGPMIGGSAFPVNPDKERWKCVIDKLYLREHFIAMEAAGIVSFTVA